MSFKGRVSIVMADVGGASRAGAKPSPISRSGGVVTVSALGAGGAEGAEPSPKSLSAGVSITRGRASSARAIVATQIAARASAAICERQRLRGKDGSGAIIDEASSRAAPLAKRQSWPSTRR
jgi:hypothetical protein